MGIETLISRVFDTKSRCSSKKRRERENGGVFEDFEMRKGRSMSKYDKLWDWVAAQPGEELTLTFDEVGEHAGVPLDHSFLNYKKELVCRGWEVGKISMKHKTVQFSRVSG